MEEETKKLETSPVIKEFDRIKNTACDELDELRKTVVKALERAKDDPTIDDRGREYLRYQRDSLEYLSVHIRMIKMPDFLQWNELMTGLDQLQMVVLQQGGGQKGPAN